MTFNSQNQQTGSLKSRWNSNTNSWEDKYRFVNFVHNTANEVIAYTEESNINGVWQTPKLYSNIVWENKNGPMLSYTAEVIVNNVAISGSKYAKVYGSNGSYIENFQNLVNGVWENSIKDTYDHDAFGNPLGRKREHWQNGSWVKSLHQNYIHTYNANNDITETVFQNFQTGTQNYANTSKMVYSNFQHFNIAGLKDKAIQEISANIYLNPTENLLIVEMPEKAQNVTT